MWVRIRPSSGGANTLLFLCFKRHVRHYPASGWPAPTDQFSGCHFGQCFSAQQVFHDKSSLEASSTNVTNHSFGRNLFVELPAFHLARCPHSVLAALSII